MPKLIASLLLRGATHDRRGIPIFAMAVMFLLAIATVSTVKRNRSWRFFAQWLSGLRGRDWTVVSAVVDVVSVVPQTEPVRGYGVEVVGYLATLTYFYRNPELQTGDYSRMFDNEEDGQAWAAFFKGRSVMVHVDPRDSSRSVLRKEELRVAPGTGL